MVGQYFLHLLHDHPDFEVTMVAASARSKGQRYDDVAHWMVSDRIPDSAVDLVLHEATVDCVQDTDVDLFFSALPSNVAGPVEEAAAIAGIPVFSNAGAHRMRPDVPILIPEINSTHLGLVKSQSYGRGFIVTNSNCSTSGLVFGLKPLMRFEIEEVNVTTMQAVSGAGRTGVASLDILGNVIPYIGKEEEKMESEPQKILGEFLDGSVTPAAFTIKATCTRVPVVNGHMESITVRLEDSLSVADAIEAFESFTGDIPTLGLHSAPAKPLVVLKDQDRPQPTRDLFYEDPSGMSVKIGRIRKKGDSLHFILLVHNTIRGAAGASILNAEYALQAGYLSEVIT